MFSTELPFNLDILTNFMTVEKFVECVKRINDAVIDAAVGTGVPKLLSGSRLDARDQVLFDAATVVASALTVENPGLRFVLENGERFTNWEVHVGGNNDGQPTATHYKRVNLYIVRNNSNV